jgi:hypothetical protein
VTANVTDPAENAIALGVTDHSFSATDTSPVADDARAWETEGAEVLELEHAVANKTKTGTSTLHLQYFMSSSVDR